MTETRDRSIRRPESKPSGLVCAVAIGASLICVLVIATAPRGHSAHAAGFPPWVWLEGEEWAQSNFPSGSAVWQSRGRFCATCSAQEALGFAPDAKGRPFDPPGYWFATYYFDVPEDAEYGAVWIAITSATAAYAWSVDGQSALPARSAEVHNTYGADGYRWVRLDASEMDLSLGQKDNPHTLTLRRDDPDAGFMAVDAILLSADLGWRPEGIAKPEVDRAYLDSYTDYVVFSSSYLDHILPDTVPDEREITGTLRAYASLGEYEPLTFAIHARRDLLDVSVTAGDLRQGDYVIPADCIEIHPVEVITKRLQATSQPHQTELVPEILGRNEPRGIPEGQTKQYWLTAHVPLDARPGEYTGKVTIRFANASSATLQIEIGVLPIALEKRSDRSHRMSYHPLSEFAGETLAGDPNVYLRQDLLDIQAHGIDSMNVNQPVVVSLDQEGEVVLDYSRFDAYLDLLVELGFTKPAHWPGIGRLANDLRGLGVDEARIAELFVQVARRVYEAGPSRGWPEIYFMPVDEPFGRPQREADLYTLVPLLRSALPDAIVECSMGGAAEMPPEADGLIDVRYFNGWNVDTWLSLVTFQGIGHAAAASGDGLGCYYNMRRMGGRPEFSRLSFGLYNWNSPFSSQGVWTYRLFSADPYDDTDGDFPDLFYAYPDPENNYAPLFPTLRWEGVREGIDDVRYLDTLELAMENATGDPAKAAAVTAAEAFLQSLRERLSRYGPELRGLRAYLAGADYDEIRWEAASAIMTLQAPAVTPTPSSTAIGAATPSATSTCSPTPTRAAHRAHIPLLLMP